MVEHLARFIGRLHPCFHRRWLAARPPLAAVIDAVRETDRITFVVFSVIRIKFLIRVVDCQHIVRNRRLVIILVVIGAVGFIKA